jgi:preprotein translocase subunit SecB
MNNNQTPELSNITIEIQGFYAKEQSCKVPHGYQTFQSTDKLENQTEISINKQAVTQDTYEVTVNITVTGKYGQKTAYTVNVQQACVLKIGSKDEQQLNQIMNISIPNLIYPYVRKAIADLIGSAGFTPLFLPIIDFASMQQQQQAKAAETAVELVS